MSRHSRTTCPLISNTYDHSQGGDNRRVKENSKNIFMQQEKHDELRYQLVRQRLDHRTQMAGRITMRKGCSSILVSIATRDIEKR